MVELVAKPPRWSSSTDATTAFSTAMNDFVFQHIFPRISRVASCDELTFL